MPTPMTDTVPDFRVHATYGLAIAAIFLLSPFAINNFFQQRFILGVGSLIIVGILALNAWSISRGRFSEALLFYGLVPVQLIFITIGFKNQGIIAALWCYPIVLSVYCMLPERKAWIANGAVLMVALPAAWQHLDWTLTTRVSASLIMVSVFSAIFVRAITSQQHALHTLVATDPLTGLHNRTLLGNILTNAYSQHQRAKTPMALLVIDLDHFKQVNDRFGHDAGDQVLRGVSQLLKLQLRRSDSIFRMGGEEFLVLLYGSTQQDGMRIAEAIRSKIESQPLLPGHVVTASIGVASADSSQSWPQWAKRGDELLYQAKEAGRNCVIG